MFRKLFYLVSAFMVVGLIGPVAAQEVDMEIGFVMQPPVLDGQVDEIWADASTQNMVPLEDPANASGSWMALYDSENLYVIVDVTDDSLQNDSASSWQDDSVEIYFDGGNTKVDTPLSGDDHQYTFGWTTDEIQGTNIDGYTEGIEHAQVDTDTGWRIEIKMPWLSIWGVAPQAGDLIGIDCYYNDDDDGGDSREGKMLGFSAVEGWNDASQWGTAILAAIPEPVPVDPGAANLVHSWTFDDGMADDIVGDANGTLVGDAAVVDGQLVLDGEGDWMDMPGDVISMNTFEGLTIEIQFTSVAGGNTGFHMVTAFGEEGTGDNPGYGYKYVCITPARGDNVSRAMIQTVSMDNDPWSEETGVSDVIEHDDGLPHHMVCTVDNTELAFYIDGVLIGTAALDPPGNSIAGIGTDAAHIGKGVYGVDPLWAGSVDYLNLYNRALSEGEIRYLAGERVPILVDQNGDIAAANELAMPGDTIEIAEGTYVIAEAIELKDGVTYRGAGAGLTIIDGNDVTRAFTAWGDRGATNGQVDENGDGVPNATGQTDWVLEGLTIQNCASDTENRQDILSAARDLLNNYTGTPYTLATAQEENGGITNNPEWFDILSGSADDDLTDAELQAYLDANPVGSEGHLVVNDDKRDDGGAVLILNGADGTIRNCEFSNNTADDDGGAILVDGQALVVAIEDCTFNLNSCGDVGGAVSLSGNNSNSTVTGCSFTDCTADDDGGAIKMEGAGDGGSIYTVTDCTFTGCSASDDGGAIFANADRSSYVWTDCTFTGNYSGDDGAAVKYAPDNADMTVTNCAFIGNGKDADGAVVNDDSVWQTNDDDAGSLTFINCLFADNAVKDDRLIEVKAVFAFQNCTFANNVVGDKTIIAIRGRAWNSTGDVDANGDDIDDVFTDASVVNNCLFINNTTDGDVIGDNRKDDGVFAVTVTNCLFYGNVDLNGTDPADNVRDVIVEVGTIDVSAVTDAAQIVVDPAGDYHLAAGSPAIDASDPATAADADIEGTAAVGVRDVGAYESAN